jgi:hypothetical protein
VITKESTDFTGLVVAIVDLALEITADKQRALVVLAEDIDLSIVEELSLVALDDLKALVLGWCPHSDALVRAARQDVLTSIYLRELTRVHLTHVSLEAVDELAILPIEHPYELVLATCHEHITLRMPLQEVQVLTRTILESALEVKGVCVPDADLIVHASCRKVLAIVIELDELHRLSMSWQVLVMHRLEPGGRCSFLLLFTCFLLHHAPDDGLVVAIASDECVVGLSRHCSYTEHRVFVLPGELYHRVVRHDLMSENLPLLVSGAVAQL